MPENISLEVLAKLEKIRLDAERVSCSLKQGSYRMIGLQKLTRDASGALDEMADELAKITHPKEVS